MKTGYTAQKVLFAIAAGTGGLGLVGVVAGSRFLQSLSLNGAWIYAISLPVVILTCIASSGLFLLIRLFQGKGLGRPCIFATLGVLAGYLVLVAVNVVTSHTSHAGPRQRLEAELATLTTNVPAFFDRLRKLAPLDEASRGQSESLIGYQAFRKPNPLFVSNYFARGRELVPPGAWINRSLLFGIQEMDPMRDAMALSNLTIVLQLVSQHEPSLLAGAFAQRGQTNTLRGFLEEDARSRASRDLDTAVLKLLPDAALH